MAVPLNMQMQKPRDVQSQARAAGALFGGGIQAIGKGMSDVTQTVDGYQKMVKQSDFVTRAMRDAIQTFGLTQAEVDRLPTDVTPDEVQDVITSYKMVDEEIKRLDEKYGDKVATPNAKMYFGINRKQAKETLEALKKLDTDAQERIGRGALEEAGPDVTKRALGQGTFLSGGSLDTAKKVSALGADEPVAPEPPEEASPRDKYLAKSRERIAAMRAAAQAAGKVDRKSTRLNSSH